MVKRYLTIVLVALLAMLNAVGCLNGKGAIGTPKVSSPVTFNYLVVNPVEIKQREHNNDLGSRDTTFTISGLKDKNLESKINKRLEAFYKQVKDAPLAPYRGIRVTIPEGSTLAENHLYAHPSFNYNNILSVVVNNHRAYKVPGQDYFSHSSVTETLNINLRTGEDIKLQDLFTDDADGLKLLGDHVRRAAAKNPPGDETYHWGGGVLRLVTPFKGLRKDQKFHLFSGGITLLFDYKTPEFETNLWPLSFSLFFKELGPVVALPERFKITNPHIYSSTAPLAKELLQPRFEGFFPEPEERNVGKVTIHNTLQIPGDLPEPVKGFILGLNNDVDQVVASLNRKSPGASSYFLSHHVNARRVGPYLVVHKSQNISANRDEGEARTDNYCFDENYRQLRLQDLFKAGYNYEPPIRQALEQGLINHGIQNNYRVDDLMTTLQFTLGTAELSFFTKPIKLGGKSGGGTRPLIVAVPFVAFGCDNLTIFK